MEDAGRTFGRCCAYLEDGRICGRPGTCVDLQRGCVVCEAHARARRTDPATSHLAALEVEASGRAASQRRKCLEVVLREPGLTAAEIARAAGLERHAASRRLPELRRAGLVESRDPRICRVQGTRAMTWWPVLSR